MEDDDQSEVESEEVENEPTAPDTPAPTPEVPADTPWAQDIAAQFDDPATRAAVDGFLREKVQPYVTQLEQSTQVNRDAERLWNDFTSEPVDTFGAVAVELFGQEKADALRELLSQEDADVDTEETLDDDTTLTIDDDELPEHVREAVEYVQNERQQREWDQAFNQVVSDNEDIDIPEELFYPFVTAADGDLDAAVDAYRGWYKTAQEKFGLNPPNPDDIPDPPPTVKTGNPTAPPTERKGLTLDDAMDEFFAEQNAPPTV